MWAVKISPKAKLSKSTCPILEESAFWTETFSETNSIPQKLSDKGKKYQNLNPLLSLNLK